MTTAPIVAIDTETICLDARRRLAWDVAMIRREPGGAETEHQFFIDVDLADADPFALNIGGFYKRHPLGRFLRWQPMVNRNRPAGDNYYGGHTPGRLLIPRVAAEAVAQVTHGAHLVGAIPSFDAQTLEELLRNNGLTPAWHYHIMDVEAMAVGFIRGEHGAFSKDDPAVVQEREVIAPPWKSDDLGRLLGVEPPSEEERHTALGDARMALRWYDRIMGTSAGESAE